MLDLISVIDGKSWVQLHERIEEPLLVQIKSLAALACQDLSSV
jgi:hypothetical protein